MAVTKAQLAIWMLITGLSVWGSAMLARVKLPQEAAGSAPIAMTVVATARNVAPIAEQSRVATVLPAVVPVFPFPDDLVRDTDAFIPVTEPVANATAFGEVQGSATSPLVSIGPEDVRVVGEVAPTEAVDIARVVPEEPPIPMPARPVIEQPVAAIPLSEVKTLYVVADALNVRAAPSTTGPVLQKLPLGFAVAAREQSNEWIGFLLQDGSTGWMRNDYLSETMPTGQPVVAPVPDGSPLNLMM